MNYKEFKKRLSERDEKYHFKNPAKDVYYAYCPSDSIYITYDKNDGVTKVESDSKKITYEIFEVLG